MNIVEIKALTKKFKDIIAVDNISLNIEQGEIYGLLGPNGAGKSTTIKIISGLLKKNKGEVLVLGKNIDKHSTFTKQNMGIVPQNITIYSDLTASENVSFFASLYGLKGEKLKKQTQEALEFVDLADKANQFPKSFSGGMKRRLNIACAIAHRPKLIIMDEPTVGIDPQSRNHILESVKKLNQLGCTIIYTTHYMEEVESLCSKIGIIDHGKLIAEGTNAELKSIVSDRKSIIISVDDSSKINTHKLSEIEGVLDVVVIENTLKIANKKEINNWDKIIMLLNKSEVIIKNIESEAPSLETVFLTLTGRKLRD